MNEYEWIAWQAVSDLVRMVMISSWIYLGWIVWRFVLSDPRKRGRNE